LATQALQADGENRKKNSRVTTLS